MSSTPIINPGGYTPARALVSADTDGSAVQVSSAAPLPVSLGSTAPAPAALSGTLAASGSVGPFTPVAGKPVILALSGTWSGSVRLLRSTDGGTTRLPLTMAGAAWAQYSANCCEPVWEEYEAGAQLYLSGTVTSGSIAYRVSQ